MMVDLVAYTEVCVLYFIYCFGVVTMARLNQSLDYDFS